MGSAAAAAAHVERASATQALENLMKDTKDNSLLGHERFG
jgi:hypothetical protein